MSDSDSEGSAASEPDLEQLTRQAAEAKLLRAASGRGSSGEDDAEAERDVDRHESPSGELLWTAERGLKDRVSRLLQNDRTLVQARDDDGYTPLHRAAYNDHAEIVELLLAAGADPAARTGELWTPLHSAARWNSVACIRLLVLHGADVNAVTSGGLTPLMVATSNASARDACFLLLNTPGVKLDATNDSGDTAVAIAARSAAIMPLFEMAEPYMTDI